jgi:RNA polymerase sigma-70 factor (ECF subfamily)
MSDPRPSDDELIRAFRHEGDRTALNELILRHVGWVRAMIYGMVLNDADADELSQEVFVRAIRGLPRFRGDARFSTWLRRIATNTVRTFRASASRPAAPTEDCLAEHADARADTPEQLAVADELDERITEALGSLSPPLRAAIVLTAIEGVAVREAARIENCPVATMYWRIHKARRILKKRLARYLP